MIYLDAYLAVLGYLAGMTNKTESGYIGAGVPPNLLHEL